MPRELTGAAWLTYSPLVFSLAENSVNFGSRDFSEKSVTHKESKEMCDFSSLAASKQVVHMVAKTFVNEGFLFSLGPHL